MTFRIAAATRTVDLSPAGRGRIASKDAIRVRGLALSWDLIPSPGATRRPLPTGEVKKSIRL
jgi:hypothetical protein